MLKLWSRMPSLCSKMPELRSIGPTQMVRTMYQRRNRLPHQTPLKRPSPGATRALRIRACGVMMAGLPA